MEKIFKVYVYSFTDYGHIWSCLFLRTLPSHPILFTGLRPVSSLNPQFSFSITHIIR